MPVVVLLSALLACGGGGDGDEDAAGSTTTTTRRTATTERTTTTEDRTTTTRPGTSTTGTVPKAPTTTTVPKAPTTTRPPGAGPSTVDRNISLPSGNIGCYLTAESVRCDIAERSWEPPPRPPDCELDWGQGVVLDERGTQFVCAGDTVLGAEEILEYGDAIEVGPFQCSSATTGVTCRDVRDGHGFSLARSGYDEL